jgi:hypothetical protein
MAAGDWLQCAVFVKGPKYLLFDSMGMIKNAEESNLQTGTTRKALPVTRNS